MQRYPTKMIQISFTNGLNFGGFKLREREIAYNADYRSKKAGIGLENTYYYFC